MVPERELDATAVYDAETGDGPVLELVQEPNPTDNGTNRLHADSWVHGVAILSASAEHGPESREILKIHKLRSFVRILRA